MTQSKNSDCPCECARTIGRRDFLKLAATAGLMAGCNPAQQLVNPTDEPTATPVPEPTDTPIPEPTALVIPTAVPDLTGKKVVYILPSSTYAPACHTASRTLLEEGVADITFASWQLQRIPAWGGNGPSLIPDMLVNDVLAADFDALIFECGQYINVGDAEAQRIVQEAVAQDKMLGAICMMPAILAAAGVLEGKRAACNDNYADSLANEGAILTGATVERDGNIVTASFDGHDLFGWVIAGALAG